MRGRGFWKGIDGWGESSETGQKVDVIFGKMPRRTSAPRVPGPIFILSCVSVGAVPVADPPSQVPPTRVPAGARTLEFSKIVGAGSRFSSGSENFLAWLVL